MIYKIGIDVGGTNTDAVILDENNQVIQSTKSPTTADVETGIFNALDRVLSGSSIDYDKIKYVMLGTTHATNAIIEKKRLAKITVVRICLPAGTAIEPMFTWDDSLKEAIGNQYYFIHGGCDVNGRPLHKPGLILEECEQILEKIKNSGAESIAVTSIFSPVLEDYEKQFAELAKEKLGPDVPITLSSEIGNLGLLERENSAALNASLVKVADLVSKGLEKALERYGISANIYFAQNDGTLMSIDYARKYPILTIGSGPTNSICGAAHLSNLKDCIVCNIGGTTTDVGILIKGFPRESAVAVDIGGVRTNFRMPDLISIGLGGGTIVRIQEDGEFTIGPDSVGYRLPEKSLIFGGDTVTTTDVAAALGKVKLGDVSKVAHLDKALLQKVYAKIVELVEEAIDKMKTSAEDVPVILVGGGSILLPEQLKGASEVIRPHHSGVANAIGAAISQVSGQVERIYKLDEFGRDKALEMAKDEAKQEAIKAGADPDNLVIVDIEDVPLAYLPGNATRIRVKAAGELSQVEVKEVI